MTKPLILAGYKIGDKGGGKLHFPNRNKTNDFAKRLADGTRIVLEIREDETEMIRSHRGYYFGVVVIHVAKCLRDAGYLIDPTSKTIKDGIHELLKKKFLDNSIEVENMAKETIELPPSTKRLNDEGWKDYLTNIIVWVAEMWGYVIPVKMSKYYFPTDEPVFNNYKQISARMGG